MGIELVHVGFGNIVAMNRVIAITSPNSAPIKRAIQEVRNKGLLIDLTNGRRTKAVIAIDSGHIILAALAPETIAGRLQARRGEVYQSAPGQGMPGDERDEL
jgi:regulator of extracellular matrix RemA (YlzA/DUF370 family)